MTLEEKMFTFKHTDLSSRNTASQERQRLMTVLSHSQKTEIDLSNVESMSESFSDEFFGVIVLSKGYDYLRENIVIKNAKPNVKTSIGRAILRRKTTR